jgi:hypothetical protein
LSHKPLTRLGEPYDRRRRPASFLIWNHDRLAAFHDRDHRVGGSKINPDDLTHLLKSSTKVRLPLVAGNFSLLPLLNFSVLLSSIR